MKKGGPKTTNTADLVVNWSSFFCFHALANFLFGNGPDFVLSNLSQSCQVALNSET